MSDWKEINKDPYNYSYGGFLISYSFEIINRRAVDHMKATKKFVNNQGESEEIKFEATGDTYPQVKEKICNKIDAYNEANE